MKSFMPRNEKKSNHNLPLCKCITLFYTENMQSKIDMLEAKQGADVGLSNTQMQIINQSMDQLSRKIFANEDRIDMEYSKIKQLELERTLDRVDMQNLTEIITHLKNNSILDQVANHNINTSITNLELEVTTLGADIKTLNISINILDLNSGKHQTDFQNLRANISKIETAVKLDPAFTELQGDIRDQNQTLIYLQESMKKDRALILNMNDTLSVLDVERQTDIVTIKANSERLTQLCRDNNATIDLLHSLEKTVSYLEGINMPQLENRINATNDLHHSLGLRVSYLEDIQVPQLGRDINATYDLHHNLQLRVSRLEGKQLPQIIHDINATADLYHRLDLRVFHIKGKIIMMNIFKENLLYEFVDN